MNIPEIYLVEPYNAYAPKRKKHWMEEVEEQALLAKIIAEQQAIQEAQANRSTTLPPQAPPVSQQTAQSYAGGAGAAGGPNTGGGAGCAPRPQFFTPQTNFTFTRTPSTSSAPTAVQFVVAGGENTLALGGAQVAWNFGDGTTGGSAATSHIYNATGSFDATMTVTSTKDGSTLATQTLAITMSVPTVASSFTLTGATVQLTNGYYTASVNDTITFVNGASTNNALNPLTYNWAFGSASLTSTVESPTLAYTNTGSYSVTLGVTGSYNAKASGTRIIKITGSI